MSHKYYSPLRPLSLGTFPKPQGNEILHIENFKERQNVPEIARQAWGYIEYKEALTEIEAAAYELIPSNCISERVVRVSATAGILYRRLLRLAASSAVDRAVFITFRRAYKRAGNSNHALEATQEREAKNENNKHFELKGRRSQDLYSGKHGV